MRVPVVSGLFPPAPQDRLEVALAYDNGNDLIDLAVETSGATAAVEKLNALTGQIFDKAGGLVNELN